MRYRLISALFSILLVSGVSCAKDDIPPLSTTQCLCTGNTCPENRCNFEIVLTETCRGRADKAEVLIETYLESGVSTPDASYTSCYSIKPGDTATLIIRADDWEWGPTNETCTPDRYGKSIQLRLDCCECVTNQDCIRLGKGSVCQPDCVCQLSQ